MEGRWHRFKKVLNMPLTCEASLVFQHMVKGDGLSLCPSEYLTVDEL